MAKEKIKKIVLIAFVCGIILFFLGIIITASVNIEIYNLQQSVIAGKTSSATWVLKLHDLNETNLWSSWFLIISSIDLLLIIGYKMYLFFNDKNEKNTLKIIK